MARLTGIRAPHRFNILIVGPDRDADMELQRLRPLLPDSVHTCRLPGPLHLPDERGAALVLRNVGALDPVQQSELSQWLESGKRGPVVSLHPSSLFDRVLEGVFSEQLYYRLNMILETADTARDALAAATAPGACLPPAGSDDLTTA